MNVRSFVFVCAALLCLSACGESTQIDPCSVTKTADGAAISCPDGTSVDLKNGASGDAGQNGTSCSVESTENGGAKITCDDGSSAVLPKGPPER